MSVKQMLDVLQVRTHRQCDGLSRVLGAFVLSMLGSWAFVLLALAGPSGLSAQDQEPASAQGILERARAALQPPVELRTRTQGIEATVLQMVLADGTLATRVETAGPRSQITITRGDEVYDAFPDYGVIIDRSLLLAPVHQAIKQLKAAAGQVAESDVSKTSTLKGVITKNGRECYEIETALSMDVNPLVANLLPGATREMLPAKRRFLIDRETLMLVEEETLSLAGASLNHVEYLSILPSPALDDELFLPPDGLDLKQPKTHGEYAQILMEMYTSRQRTQATLQRVRDRFNQAAEEIEQRAEEHEHRIEKAMNAPRSRPAHPPRQPAGSANWILILVNLVLLAIAAILWLWKRHFRRNPK